jgi:superfamily II DNA or RNA helicase
MSNHSQLVLVSRVKHIKILQDMLNNLGVQSVSLSGTTHIEDRKEILDGMRTGKYNILIATIQLAKEGLDIPILNRLHLVTPSKNVTMVKQAAGRIERNIKGKKHPFIMDYVDTEIMYCVNMFKRRKNILK